MSELLNLSALYKDKNHSFSRQFAEINYEKTLWLSCWLSMHRLVLLILFAHRSLCGQANDFLISMKHDKRKEKAHIPCFIKLQTFGNQAAEFIFN